MEKVKTEKEVAEAVLSKAKSMLDSFLKKKEELDKMEEVHQIKDPVNEKVTPSCVCHASLKKSEKLRNFLARKHIKRMAKKAAPKTEGV